MKILRKLIKMIYIKIKYFHTHAIIKSTYISLETEIGQYCQIGKNVKIGKQCSIDNFSYINQNTIIEDKVHVGKYCSISENVRIAPGEHPLNYLSTHPLFYDKNYQKKVKMILKTSKEYVNPTRKPTIIENDVWIGMNVIIKQGVTIGNGAVIGAGAIVTRNVQPYTIVAGVPATFIRNRFDYKIIEQLQKEKWWDKELNDIETTLNI